MKHIPPDPEFKSADRLSFEVFLRTGKRLAVPPERKFNPYHDPRNGQFTFAPGGPRSSASAIGSDRQGPWRRLRKPTAGGAKVGALEKRPATGVKPSRLNAQTALPKAQLHLAGGRRGPRRGRGSGGRRPNDPMLLDEVFPGLAKSPAGTLIKMADHALDLSTAANEVTREVHRAQVRTLVAQIREIDPDYRFVSLGEPDTIEGRVNEIKALRFRRALAFAEKRGEYRPLQVEVLRVMQERADAAYDEAVELYEIGELTPRLSREEAIGNYVDGSVRGSLRRLFNGNGVNISRGQPVRVVGREYDTSGTDRTYRIPDARVANVAFDVTLTGKSMRTPQVRGFFNSDFRPDVVIIIRPRQLGGTYTYAITKPGN